MCLSVDMRDVRTVFSAAFPSHRNHQARAEDSPDEESRKCFVTGNGRRWSMSEFHCIKKIPCKYFLAAHR